MVITMTAREGRGRVKPSSGGLRSHVAVYRLGHGTEGMLILH